MHHIYRSSLHIELKDRRVIGHCTFTIEWGDGVQL